MILSVRGYLQITDDEGIEDNADAMATEIETRITHSLMNAELSNKCHGLYLTDSSFTVDIDEQERVQAILSVDYSVLVYTDEGLPETLK